jgi:hypothetical protein
MMDKVQTNSLNRQVVYLFPERKSRSDVPFYYRAYAVFRYQFRENDI